LRVGGFRCMNVYDLFPPYLDGIRSLSLMRAFYIRIIG
jgi:hypothetical protein